MLTITKKFRVKVVGFRRGKKGKRTTVYLFDDLNQAVECYVEHRKKRGNYVAIFSRIDNVMLCYAHSTDTK